MMKLILYFLAFTLSLASAEITPKEVAILYNSNIAESKNLAKYYAQARGIPQTNLIGLPLTGKDQITRNYYKTSIQEPLRNIFTKREWWTIGRDSSPSSCKISTLVCMRGVPYKIARIPKTPEEKAAKTKALITEAAVDSELALLGVHGLPLHGPAKNPYYKKDVAFSKAKTPTMILVGRIDGPDYQLCKNMIDDAIITEKKGLWGMCYLDFSLKNGGYQQGDDWLENIAALNHKKGIPTASDRNKQTLTTNYPMDDCAVYFGWYTANKNGPLLNPEFRFRKGAIATHLHSFSAQKLRDSEKGWSGPIIAHGAAATLGNVYEPYLHLVHHYDIFYSRLIKGYTLIEAAYMSAPALSWQNIVVGDPLYRPFIHLDGSGVKDETDKDYRAIRLANSIWANEPNILIEKLATAADAKNRGSIYEYLGLRSRYKNNHDEAIKYFKLASENYLKETSQLRQWLFIADTQRSIGNKEDAIKTLKWTQDITANIPELLSVKAILNILDPPTPPPVQEIAKP